MFLFSANATPTAIAGVPHTIAEEKNFNLGSFIQILLPCIISNANISVVVDNKFMEAVEKGEKYWNDLHDQEFLETAWERSHNPGWWLGLLDDEFTYSGDMARQVDMMEDND